MFYSQKFECPNCGDTITSSSPASCDQLEGTMCDNCRYGCYAWVGPVDGKKACFEQFDDVETELDRAFAKIVQE